MRPKTFRLQILLSLLPCALLLPQSVPSYQADKPAPKSNAPQPDLASGKRMFERHCALCHGMDGKGGRGPDLNRPQLFLAPDDNALKAVISDGIPPEMPDGWFFSEEEVADIAAYVRSLGKIPAEPLRGDPAHGALAFSKNGCSRCHLFAASGFAYGPELTDIAERRSSSYVRYVITAPAERLPDGFLFIRAITASGRTIEGIRMNEDTFSIQIKDATGNFYSFRKQDLRDLQKLRGQTPMPSYKTILSATELDDLIAYLFSPRGSQ